MFRDRLLAGLGALPDHPGAVLVVAFDVTAVVADRLDLLNLAVAQLNFLSSNAGFLISTT